jgi:hypothetical protein
MGLAVLLSMGMGVLWVSVMVLQFIALPSLITIGPALWAVIAMYELSFLGFYFILSETNIG